MYVRQFFLFFNLVHARLPNSVKKAQVLLVYPLILLITWAQQVPMSHEYDLLLQTFLNNEGMDEAHLHHSVAEYFKASHATTMLATGGRGDNSRIEGALTKWKIIINNPYSSQGYQKEAVFSIICCLQLFTNSGGWTSIGRICIDHY
jgi:hypothetical protein